MSESSLRPLRVNSGHRVLGRVGRQSEAVLVHAVELVDTASGQVAGRVGWPVRAMVAGARREPDISLRTQPSWWTSHFWGRGSKSVHLEAREW